MRDWFAGEFEHCLELCDRIRLRGSETRTHVALLRARALLRLDRPDDALRVLHDASSMPCGTDEALTARMLVGAARIRRGDVQDGLKLLLSAQHDAGHAYPTIQAEIALNVGLAHYAKRDLAAAERALARVPDDADLVYARAIQYSAWIALARDHTDGAAAAFVAALGALDACRYYDRFFDANCTRALAHLAAERLDPGIWPVVETRRERIDWSAAGLAEPRFFIAYCAAAYQLDVQGNPLEAAREARLAERLAPSDAFRVQARCKRAAVARYAGETLSHRDHVESAAELLAGCDPSALSGDEKTVPLILAEELAYIDPNRARAMFALHGQLSPLSPARSATQTHSTSAYRSVIEGAVLEHVGERQAAVRCYREAFDVLSAAGYRRRAVIAALRLAELTGDRKLEAYAARAASHVSAQSWLSRELNVTRSRGIKLTGVQREVLALICQGKSNPEIARSRKRSLHTIRNLVARLFEIFEVSSREELAVQCVRQGLYTPT
jgi:DNA-binding CsgD family transcriptional regulator